MAGDIGRCRPAAPTSGSVSVEMQRFTAIVQEHSVAVRRMHRYIRTVATWWRGSALPARRWQIYFYYHITMFLLLGGLALLDSRQRYPDDWAAAQAPAVRVVVHCAFGIVFGQAALLAVIAPFLSARLLWSARKGGPSFIALAFCDTAATFGQYLALMILCS